MRLGRLILYMRYGSKTASNPKPNTTDEQKQDAGHDPDHLHRHFWLAGNVAKATVAGTIGLSRFSQAATELKVHMLWVAAWPTASLGREIRHGEYG